MDIAFNIRRRRMELGISQEALAKRLGYKSRSTIAKIEAGSSDIPLSKLLELSRALDTSIEDLLTGIDQTPPSDAMHREASGNRKTIGVMLAGGQSTRNLQNIPNQFINVMGKPVIAYCMETYQRHPLVDDIYVVCRSEWNKIVAAYSKEYGITKMRGTIPAGSSGVLSAFAAIHSLVEMGYSENDIVVLQESTRPFVTEEIISKLLATCHNHGNAIICEAMSDYVQYQIIGETTSYLDRETVVDLQSPEAHTIKSLVQLAKESRAQGHKPNESCIGLLMTNLGLNLNFCEGNHNNIKIVRQEDLAIFSALLKSQKP